VALEPGSEFAGYVIERLLGAGGMGEVYVARHPRLPRSDALKVLAPQFAADPQFRARFEREADLAAGLSHHSIVSVHDRGEFDGHLWMALELIEGRDASAMLREHPQGVASGEVGRIVSAVAEALDFAGAGGLIHRDVKPANILLSNAGGVLLTDFGIARMGPENSELTATGTTVGTLNYSSPEQLRGDPLDARSDQYALAATAFHMLTGSVPFPVTNAGAVIIAHATKPVPSVRHARPDLSPAVDHVIARGMAKEPAQRFTSSRDFASALTAAFNRPAEPPTVPPPARMDPDRTHLRVPDPALGTPTVARPTPKGNATRKALAVAIIAALVAGAVGYGGYRWWKSMDPSEGPTAEAAALAKVGVTPLMASLENKLAAPRWRVAKNLAFVAADEKTAVYAAWGSPTRLTSVDATTGKPTREPFVYTGTGLTAGNCLLRATRLACGTTAGAGFAASVVDLGTGATVRLAEAQGPYVAFFGDVPVSYSAKAATGYRLDGSISWRLTGETVKVYPAAGMAIAISPPPSGDPFAKGEIRIVAGDGRVLLQRELTASDQKPDVSGSATGLLLKTNNGPLEVVSTDGSVRTGPDGWIPAWDCSCDSPAPPLPVVRKDIGKEILVGTVNPATGNLLWARKMFGKRPDGASDTGSVAVHGLGTKIVAAHTQPFKSGPSVTISELWDAYTAVGGSLYSDGPFVGTDGDRALGLSSGWIKANEVGKVPELWTLNYQGSTVHYAGAGIYVDDSRVI
jgi:serine/threonine-protein kinase